MTDEERLRALFSNLKNWDWTVHAQYKLEREDAEVLLNATDKMRQELFRVSATKV